MLHYFLLIYHPYRRPAGLALLVNLRLNSIDINNVIKVADFGLSEDVYSRKYFRQGSEDEDGEAQVKLPVRWMPAKSALSF